jgi:hypothetical protein
MTEDKRKTLLFRPQNRRDWLLYALSVVLVLAAVALAVLDLGYHARYAGIVWPILLALAVLLLARRNTK